MCGSPSTVTTTNSPPAQVLQNYSDVTAQAKNVASTPYTPYSGELVAGINQGQSNAIGDLQSASGVANPFFNSGSGYLNNASGGLGAVQNYLQTAGGFLGQSAGLATPQQFSQGALQQYMSPYTNDVVNATNQNLQANNQVQAQGLASNAIGSGAFGGDRAGIAQADLARQQDLANGQTIAGLENTGYSTALGQYNQNQANQFQAAGLLGSVGQQFNALGGTQGQTAAAQGQLAGLSGYLGSAAQTADIQGGSAALQASTLQQQNQQQQDQANYQQYLAAFQYPFQTTSYLANIDEGIGQNSGGSSTSPGPSTLSQVAGATTAGLGILGAIGGSSGVSGGLSTIGSGLSSLFSDERLKEDIAPIGKTYDGQTMYRFRYKGDDTVHTGLMAQEVEGKHPDAVGLAGGFKTVDYGMATDKAAKRGHFARGGGLAAGRPHFDVGGIVIPGSDPSQPQAPGLSFGASGLTNGSPLTLVGAPPQGLAGRGNGPAGPGGATMPVLRASPSAAPATAAPALGLAAATNPAGAAGVPGQGGLGGNSDQNKWMGVLAAGLGMMGGSSPFAAVNIGQGGLEGLKMWQGLNQQDRANALAQSELAQRNNQIAISQRQADLAAQELAAKMPLLNAQTQDVTSQSKQRDFQTAMAGQQMTPAGILSRDPTNPSNVKLTPWSAIPGMNGAGAAPQPGGVALPQAAGSVGAPAAPTPSAASAGVSAPTAGVGGVDTIGKFPPPDQIPINPMTMSPMGQDLVKKNAEQQMTAAQTAYDASQSQKMYLAQMQHDLQQLPSSGWLAAGPGQQQRADVANKVVSALKTIGVTDNQNLNDVQNAIASTEDMKKITGRMGFELAKSLGGREPGFIVQQSVGLNPSTENSPIGAQRLIAGLNAAAQRNIDHYNFIQQWGAKTGGDLTGADDYFNTHASPQSYANAAITSTLPQPYVDRLRQVAGKDPSAVQFFEQRFGKGTAALALGQGQPQQ